MVRRRQECIFRRMNWQYRSIGNFLNRLTVIFEETSSYVYSKNDREKLEKEIDAVSRIGGKVEFCEATELPFATSGAVRFQGQAQFKSSEIDEWSCERTGKVSEYTCI